MKPKTACQTAGRDAPGDMNKWRILFHIKHPAPGTVDVALWKKGLPNQFCSDQDKYVWQEVVQQIWFLTNLLSKQFFF